MNIVLEGPDHAGKSTLAATLHRQTGLPVVQGEGPPKSKAEFQARVLRYLDLDGVIFDRHPCISEGVYGPIMQRESMLTSGMRRDFYASRPFIIYVRPATHELPRTHTRHDHESQAHFDALSMHHAAICMEYDRQMLAKAQYIYRRSDTHLAELAHVGALTTLLNLERRILT